MEGLGAMGGTSAAEDRDVKAAPASAAEDRDVKAAPAPAALSMRDVTFAYPVADDGASSAGAPGAEATVLKGASLEVAEGEFVLLVGSTGSGKSTLLSLSKPEIAPHGNLTGSVEVFGRAVASLSVAESSQLVGFVFQDPEAQIVCDSVWHEMAFGLENLGTPVPEMRRRVAETSHFFGIEPWFEQSCARLSGGQRQVLALASTLAMRPRLLLLDEPTSMLDPVAERNFLHALFRVNRELGITVVVATHRPAPMVDYATRAVRIDAKKVVAASLDELRSEPDLLAGFAGKGAAACADPAVSSLGAARAGCASAAGRTDMPCVRVTDAWYRYERDGDWVLRGCSLDIMRGTIHAIVGGNGSGKTTLLSALAQTSRLSRGRLTNTCADSQALLPQDPKALLGCESVEAELMEWAPRVGYEMVEAGAMLERLGLAGLEGRDPYDLSIGQQQLLALAKLLLTRPRLLLADEPTKGLDARAAASVARALCELRDAGVTVVIASHDLTFVRQVSDTTSMLFDGSIASSEPTKEFFADSLFYR